jgi:hypothetical protein
MIIYRFRITSEEQEDFLREIDIQPVQTFLDFHEIIQSCADLDLSEKAFFYTTDKKYKKHQEISLKPEKKQVKKYDGELDEIITEVKVPHLMKDSTLKKYIEDPHQKMIYEHFGKEFHAFHIELFKLFKAEDDFLLPKCVKKIGELPKKIEIPVIPDEMPEDDIIPPVIFTIPTEKEIRFSGIEENDAEIAEIESHLDELLTEKEPPAAKPVAVPPDEGDEVILDDEHMVESVGDFEDLENIELQQQNYDGDPDDY